ncbi:MAG: hypothetical protein GXO62_01670 [Epsilonproteobacteria bacterium]|nr:hypothetical protein [Campylobacterota bacterium]
MEINPYYTYYPLSFLPIYPNTQPVTFDPEYVENLISLGVTDYFSPTQFATNPLFANVDTFNQNVGILQTAVNGISKIMDLLDSLKEISNPSEDVLKTFEDQINKIIQDTTFNDLPVFSQTLKIGDEDVDLSIPLFNPDQITVDDYSKLIEDKFNNLSDTLKNVTFTLPFEEQNINPVELNIYQTLLNSGTYLNAYNTSLISPTALQLLLA